MTERFRRCAFATAAIAGAIAWANGRPAAGAAADAPGRCASPWRRCMPPAACRRVGSWRCSRAT
jgi:hypothetical protein